MPNKNTHLKLTEGKGKNDDVNFFNIMQRNNYTHTILKLSVKMHAYKFIFIYWMNILAMCSHAITINYMYSVTYIVLMEIL